MKNNSGVQKIALDLTKLPAQLDARFKCNFLDDGLLEIENKFGLPKHIYVNEKGEIWTSAADMVLDTHTIGDVVKTVRHLVAATGQQFVFKVSDLFKLIAPPNCALPQPALSEDDVFELGNGVADDILKEPEITALDLSPQDQNEVVVMVFDTVANDKNLALEGMDSELAPKISSFLNESFANLKFTHIGDDLIQVSFDSKFASDGVTREDLQDVLKFAFQDVNFTSYYESLVTEFSSKVSKSLPDYFKVRDIVLTEVLEQIK